MIGYLSRHCGFCFGVSLAVKSAYDESKDSKLCMYGEVVHNPDIIKDLSKKNVSIIDDIAQIKENLQSKVLIRAHGVPKKIIDFLNNQNFAVIDKTCPKVKRIHNIVFNAHKEKKKIIVVGDPIHPEVIGINGWCEFSAIIFKDLEDTKKNIKDLRPESLFCVVSQTTYNYEKYLKICKFLKYNLPDLKIYNTICRDTYERQRELINFSKISEMAIIVGGKKSSNTVKLFEIAKKNFKYSQHIENKEDLDMSKFNLISNFSIFSGASTPIESVYDVVNYIKIYCEKVGIKFEILDHTLGLV